MTGSSARLHPAFADDHIFVTAADVAPGEMLRSRIDHVERAPSGNMRDTAADARSALAGLHRTFIVIVERHRDQLVRPVGRELEQGGDAARIALPRAAAAHFSHRKHPVGAAHAPPLQGPKRTAFSCRNEAFDDGETAARALQVDGRELARTDVRRLEHFALAQQHRPERRLDQPAGRVADAFLELALALQHYAAAAAESGAEGGGGLRINGGREQDERGDQYSTFTSVVTLLAMKQASCARWWRSAMSASLGRFSPENSTRGCSVTRVIASFPSERFSSTPSASST